MCSDWLFRAALGGLAATVDRHALAGEGGLLWLAGRGVVCLCASVRATGADVKRLRRVIATQAGGAGHGPFDANKVLIQTKAPRAVRGDDMLAAELRSVETGRS